MDETDLSPMKVVRIERELHIPAKEEEILAEKIFTFDPSTKERFPD